MTSYVSTPGWRQDKFSIRVIIQLFDRRESKRCRVASLRRDFYYMCNICAAVIFLQHYICAVSLPPPPCVFLIHIFAPPSPVAHVVRSFVFILYHCCLCVLDTKCFRFRHFTHSGWVLYLFAPFTFSLAFQGPIISRGPYYVARALLFRVIGVALGRTSCGPWDMSCPRVACAVPSCALCVRSTCATVIHREFSSNF